MLAVQVPRIDRARIPHLVAKIPRREKLELISVLEERDRRQRQRLFHHLFPDRTHTWRGQVFHERGLYPKHLEFFSAGATHRERCFMAANRVGKTIAGGYELTCHLTGLYPHWWQGKRFDGPILAWAAGKTNETTRDILQRKLLGPVRQEAGRKRVEGTGIIPGELLGAITWKQGVADFVDTIAVRHVTGEYSILGLKSYEQGRGAFEGTERHVIWLDEEPTADVYDECLIRTATTGGIVLITFTPLAGMSQVVLQFMPSEQRPVLV